MAHIVFVGDKIMVNASYDPKTVIVRGNITDRNDIIIATDIKTKSLYINKILVKNKKFLSQKLSKILPDLSARTILRKIHSKKNSDWVLIKKNISPQEQQKIESLNIPGFVFEDDMMRIYPHKKLFSHIVGYTDLDRKGLSGIEKEYNVTLRTGKDVKIAADLKLQYILSEEISKAKEESKSDNAAGLIMDVTNGEILALASLPNFDLNRQRFASNGQRFNRITHGVYEIGSVLKILTNAIAFEEGLITLDDVFSIKDPIKYSNFTIDDNYKTKDEMDVNEIFAHSSNIGTIKIAKKIGRKLQREYFDKFGLLQEVKTDFPAIGKPIIPRRWSDISLFTISYGHGISLSPLSVSAVIAAMVNDGKYFNPSFIKKNIGEGYHKRLIKESTSKMLRSLMEKAVKFGTGKKSYLENYKIGGKTGTADKAAFGSYDKSQTISSFIAAFPIDKPKYLIFVMFDNPKTKFKAGGVVAAPVVKEIVKKIITY